MVLCRGVIADDWRSVAQCPSRDMNVALKEPKRVLKMPEGSLR